MRINTECGKSFRICSKSQQVEKKNSIEMDELFKGKF